MCVECYPCAKKNRSGCQEDKVPTFIALWVEQFIKNEYITCHMVIRAMKKK